MALKIVLFEPEIPANTGNIGRLCAATGSELHLIEPLGFLMEDRRLKRAGLDYWESVRWRKWGSWTEYLRSVDSQTRLWFVESGGAQRYVDADIVPNDTLVFGRETKGLPPALLQQHSETWITIPMKTGNVRSLNLSNCVSLVAYHVWQRHGFDW